MWVPPSPVGAPLRPSRCWAGSWGLTQKIISREHVVVPHLEDELGGQLLHRLIQAPKMLLNRGKETGGSCPVPPPAPCLPQGDPCTFRGRTQSRSAARYSKGKTKRQLKLPSPCSER